MKFIYYALFLFFLIYADSAYSQESNSYFLHTVEKGQNIYNISTMYNVSQADIIRLNPGSDQKIYAGQTLKIPQTVNREVVYHTIQPSETLYRLSVQYNVSVKDICAENPGLSAENFKAGQVIRVVLPEQLPAKEEATQATQNIQPEVKSRCKEMHKVKRKETLFSVSRDYGISQEELIAANPELKQGMKKGQRLCIPYHVVKTIAPNITKDDILPLPPSNSDLIRSNQESAEKLSVIKAALILPFLPQEGKQSESSRMIEYYEGFLLAVDSLKNSGVSIDLHVFDSGSENSSIVTLLKKEELKTMDVIIGPLYKQHIDPLASFADEHGIRLVIPILKDDVVFNNPKVYLVNTPQSYLYSEVYERFIRQFPNANVIFVDMKTEDAEKAEFIQGLKQELNKHGIAHQTVSDSQLTANGLSSSLRADKNNIFIPTSGSGVALNAIIPVLKMTAKANGSMHISMFGYPEWQTYTNEYLQDFFELDTYFFSSFYTNNIFPTSKQFTHNYRKWYSKDMINVYPKYGMLGFDTGMFFLSGLSKYGTGLEYNLNKTQLSPVQTGFKFERVNNWGGFVNKKVFFIHYTKNFELIRLDFE